MVRLDYKIDDQSRVVIFDASVNEQHSGSAEATSHPVENGTNISDNVRPLPFHLSLEVVVTNTPIAGVILAPTNGAAASVKPLSGTGANTLQFDATFDRVRDVYNDLYDAQQAGALVTITTSLSQYIDFAIVGMSVPRNAQNSQSIQFTIDFQQIVTVEVSVVDTPAAKATKKVGKKKLGSKPTVEATPEQKRSLAKAAAKKIVDALTSSSSP